MVPPIHRGHHACRRFRDPPETDVVLLITQRFKSRPRYQVSAGQRPDRRKASGPFLIFMAARRQREGTAPTDRERGRLAENGTTDCGLEIWLISMGIGAPALARGLLSQVDMEAGPEVKLPLGHPAMVQTIGFAEI
jgi:hypothetical protein